ncbi:MAG: hypothetical protein SGJ21_04680 [Alphaproteobacteria bacterium]|nr:hypothetical protein [Alphaproteobacteria bacterium]
MADTQVENAAIGHDDLFLIANVHPRRSGLPFVVYILEKQGRHDVRVKVAAGAKAPPFIASLSVRPEAAIVAGDLSGRDFDLARRWIELNRDVIIGYWDRTIEDTADALNALQVLPAG